MCLLKAPHSTIISQSVVTVSIIRPTVRSFVYSWKDDLDMRLRFRKHRQLWKMRLWIDFSTKIDWNSCLISPGEW